MTSVCLELNTRSERNVSPKTQHSRPASDGVCIEEKERASGARGGAEEPVSAVTAQTGAGRESAECRNSGAAGSVQH